MSTDAVITSNRTIVPGLTFCLGVATEPSSVVSRGYPMVNGNHARSGVESSPTRPKEDR